MVFARPPYRRDRGSNDGVRENRRGHGGFGEFESRIDLSRNAIAGIAPIYARVMNGEQTGWIAGGRPAWTAATWNPRSVTVGASD